MKHYYQIYCAFFFLPILLHAQPDTLDWADFDVPEVGGLQWIEPNHVFDFELADVDRDGMEEAVLMRSDLDYPLQMAAREIQNDSYALLPRPAHIRNEVGKRSTQLLFQLESHPVYRFLVYHAGKNAGWLRLYDRSLTLRDSIRTLRGESNTDRAHWNGSMFLPQMRDLNGDARPDLIFGINTASDGQPRALLACDLHTQETLLDLRFAPMIQAFHVLDFEGDGQPEIVVELIGAGDGPFFGPFRRNESYVAIFNHKGELLKSWEHPGPATYVRVYPADADNDGIPDLFICFFAVTECDLPSRIVLINGRTFEQEAELCCAESQLRFCGILWSHREPDGNRLLSVLGKNRELSLVRYAFQEKSFTLLRTVNNVTYSVQNKTNGECDHDDMNGDGVPEFFFPDHERDRIWIVTPDLRPLAFVRVALERNAAVHVLSCSDPVTRQYALFNRNRLHKLSIHVADVFPPPAMTLHWRNVQLSCGGRCLLVISICCLGLFAGVIALAIRQRTAMHHAALIQSERVAAFLLDSGGRFRWGNSRFLELMNASVKEVKRSDLEEILEKNKMSALSGQIELFMKTRKALAHKEIQIGPPGRQLSMALELHRQSNGHIQGMLVDLTETTQTERLRVWSAMAQRVIHKTKTPLGTILLAVQRLQKVYSKETPEKSGMFDKYVNTAVNEIEQVRQNINAFMKLARLHEMNPIHANFSEWFRQALLQFKSRVPEGVMIQLQMESEPLYASYDPDHLSEALENILDNAVYAVQGNGLIRINCQKETNPLHCFGSSGMLLIEIIDNGMGMAQQSMSKLFTPGYSTREEGSGLGLVIAHAIIFQHNGEISVESTQGIGTSICIRLPLIKKDEHETASH